MRESKSKMGSRDVELWGRSIRSIELSYNKTICAVLNVWFSHPYTRWKLITLKKCFFYIRKTYDGNTDRWIVRGLSWKTYSNYVNSVCRNILTDLSVRWPITTRLDINTGRFRSNSYKWALLACGVKPGAPEERRWRTTDTVRQELCGFDASVTLRMRRCNE